MRFPYTCRDARRRRRGSDSLQMHFCGEQKGGTLLRRVPSHSARTTTVSGGQLRIRRGPLLENCDRKKFQVAGAMGNSGAAGSSEGGGGQEGEDSLLPFPGAKGPGGAAAAAAEFEGMDWRTFRAKLVAQAQALQNVSGASTSQQARLGLEIWQDRMSLENWALLASQNPQLAREVPWVHPMAAPEVGGVLIASPSMAKTPDERYWQTVVLLLHHNARGSAGLILNRPSGYTLKKAMAQVNSIDAALSVFAGNSIYVGGYRSDGKTLHFLHGHPLPGATELVPGVYLGGLETAAEKVLEGSFESIDFRFFVGRVEWMPGKLEEEVGRGLWYPAACARSLILKQCLQLPKPLWREMLELMGGDYADTARKEYGDPK